MTMHGQEDAPDRSPAGAQLLRHGHRGGGATGETPVPQDGAVAKSRKAVLVGGRW